MNKITVIYLAASVWVVLSIVDAITEGATSTAYLLSMLIGVVLYIGACILDALEKM